MFGKNKGEEKTQVKKHMMTEQQSNLSSKQMSKLYSSFYSINANSRPYVAALEIGKLLPMFVKYASEFKHDAYMPETVKPLTDDDIAAMSDDSLKGLQDRYQQPQFGIDRVHEMKDCMMCLGAVEGWEIADGVSDEMRIVVDAYEESKAVIDSNRAMLQAEISRRDAIAAKEARKRRYIEENYIDIIETLLSGGDKDELLQTIENPPESGNSSGVQPIDVFRALQSEDSEDA